MYLRHVIQAHPGIQHMASPQANPTVSASSGSARCTSWWMLFAKAIILMRGVSGCNGGRSVPSKEGGRFFPCAQGSKELTLLTGREMFAALISGLRIFKTAGSPQ
jgi:hypothetical protein